MSVGAVNKQTGERIPTAGMPPIDSVLSGTSTNPVQNKVVNEALDGKQGTLTFDDTPIQNSTNPVKSGGVYSALAEKQNALSAGSYIDISGNAVSVNRYVNPAGDIVYRAVTVNATTAYVDKYTSGGSFIERINITVNVYQTQNVDSKIRFYREFDGWVITLLANSKEHNAGYSYSARTSAGGVESQNDFTFVISQTLDDNDLIIRSELATKADTDMVAADFNAGTSYTAGNYCVQDGKLYKFKNNHSGAWSAADVDEVKITGELSALKSGLMSRAVILGGGEISSNSSATVQLLSSHLYLVTLGHPYSEAGMAIVASYTSGSNKVTWIKTRTGVTISEDSSLVLTIAAEASVWYTVVDMGAI